MSQKPPLPNSARRAAIQQAPAPVAADSATAKIVAVIAVVSAVVIAYLLRTAPHFAAGAALVGTVAAFGLYFVFSRNGGDNETFVVDPVDELKATLEANRAESAQRIAELRKSLDAHKADNSAKRENEALREEIGKLRVELAGLRTAAGRR